MKNCNVTDREYSGSKFEKMVLDGKFSEGSGMAMYLLAKLKGFLG